MFIIFVGVI